MNKVFSKLCGACNRAALAWKKATDPEGYRQERFAILEEKRVMANARRAGRKAAGFPRGEGYEDIAERLYYVGTKEMCADDFTRRANTTEIVKNLPGIISRDNDLGKKARDKAITPGQIISYIEAIDPLIKIDIEDRAMRKLGIFAAPSVTEKNASSGSELTAG